MADLKLLLAAVSNASKVAFSIDGEHLLHRDGELAIQVWPEDSGSYILRWDIPSNKLYHWDLPSGVGVLYQLSYREMIETVVSVAHDHETI